MFVMEQRGTILELPKNAKGDQAKVLFDISGRKPYVKDEEGLLGMAFHPQFKANGKLYVFIPRTNRCAVLSVNSRWATTAR